MSEELDLDKTSNDIMDDILGDEREAPENREPEDEVQAEAPVPAEKSVETTEKKPAEQAPGATAASPSQPVATAPAAIPAPKTWRPEAASKWDALPPEVQAEVAKREQDIFNGLKQYKEFANVGQKALDAVREVLPLLQKQGQNPYAFMKDMCDVHRLLSAGTPQQKARAFSALALHYGVQTTADGQTNPLPDQMELMRQQIAQLTNQQAAAYNYQVQGVRNYYNKQVADMAADKENNPYFDEAVPIMTDLIKKGLANNLKEAYNKAIWLDPAIRAKMQANTSQAVAEQSQAKVAAASKMAAANVKGSQRAGSETTIGSMDDTLWEALRAIKNR